MATTAETIQQYFLRILLREPTGEELGAAVLQVSTGSSTLEQQRDALINSVEADVFVDPVVRLYEAAFGRKPDLAGLRVNVDAIRSGIQTGQGGITITQLADAFVVSQEFLDRFGSNKISLPFLEAVYQNVLGRAPDQVGLNTFLGPNSTITAGQALIIFSNSPEFVERARSSVDLFLTESGDGVQNYAGSLFIPSVSSTLVLTTGADTFTGGPGNDNFTGHFRWFHQ